MQETCFFYPMSNDRNCRQVFGVGPKYSWCEMFTMLDVCHEWTVKNTTATLPLSELRNVPDNLLKQKQENS